MNPNRGYFVTGTDTGVGKTQVTAALVAALRAEGVEALPVKPVQTGATRTHAPDLDFVLKLLNLNVDRARYNQLAPVRLALPASPHLAARKAGVVLQLRQLLKPIHHLQAEGITPVVEGAGGILVPLNARESMLDLMQALDLPIILVARPGLGTLNHTLLSAHALDCAGLTLAAVVLSNPASSYSAIEKDNRASLQARLACPVIALPRLSAQQPEAYLQAGRRVVSACRERS